MLNLVGPVPVTEMPLILRANKLVQWYAGSIAPGTDHFNVHLYQNNLTPAPDTVLADFVEATFDGYASTSILTANWTLGQIMTDGSALMIATALQNFFDTGTTTPNTVYGAYFTNDAGTELFGSLRFDTPKLMNDATKFIIIELGYLLPAATPIFEADVTSNG